VCAQLGGEVCLLRGGFKAASWKVSVPVSSPAPKNRPLVSGRNLGWISLL
jgi:hypothetical protein